MSIDNEQEPVVPAKRSAKSKVIGITAGGVVAAAALFGGGVALGTSLDTGTASTAQQGQFGAGGPGGSGTAPDGTAPTVFPGGGTGGTSGGTSSGATTG
jgi:hypothetical protein